MPLRILAPGKQSSDSIDADVFLPTDTKPALLPAETGTRGLSLNHSAAARPQLLDDLRADAGMAWVPRTAWLTEVGVGGA